MIDIRTGKEMTRRDFGKGIAAILSAGVAPSIAMGLVGSANASVARGMMRNVGARQAAVFGGGWKNPYVTDGLVAMWDGEWNAGGGVHDVAPSDWIDCIGGLKLPLQTGDVVSPDSITTIRGRSANRIVSTPILYNLNDSYSMEFCARYLNVDHDGSWTQQAIVCNGGYTLADGFHACCFRFDDRNTIENTSLMNFASRSKWWDHYGYYSPSSLVESRHSGSWKCTVHDDEMYVYIDGIKKPRTKDIWDGNTHSFSPQPIISVGSVLCDIEICCIRLYNKSLSEQQILKNYDADRSRFGAV